MSQRVLSAVFRREEDLRSAIRAVRAAGGVIRNVYSPYAVHGLEEDLGWRPSRLTWACAVCGAAGALFMLWFQWWASAVSWPLNVGGKPFNSWPAFVPVVFEAMVLCGAVGTVVAFLAVARLRPGKRAKLIHQAVTDDRFVLLVDQSDATFDAGRMSALLAECRGEQIEETVVDAEPCGSAPDGAARPAWLVVNGALALLLAVCVLAILLLPRNRLRPNIEYFPTMSRAVPVEPQAALARLPGGPPPAGTLAQDAARPLDYQATEQDARRAGDELANPFTSADAPALERGRYVFANFCVSCHGPSGEGDGRMVLRGYPPPPAWSSEKVRQARDGELFHVISYGRNNMPPHRRLLSVDDRWKVVLLIRDLQQRAAPQSAPGADAPATNPPEPNDVSANPGGTPS